MHRAFQHTLVVKFGRRFIRAAWQARFLVGKINPKFRNFGGDGAPSSRAISLQIRGHCQKQFARTQLDLLRDELMSDASSIASLFNRLEDRRVIEFLGLV